MLLSVTFISIGIVLISSGSENKSIDVENNPGLSDENLTVNGTRFSSDFKSLINFRLVNCSKF